MVDNKTMKERILQVSKDMGIPTKKIRDFLYVLSGGEPIDNNVLLQRLGVSKNALNQAKETLSDLLEAPSKNTQLKVGAVKEIQSLFDSEYQPEEVLWSTLEDEHYEEAMEILKKYGDKRPIPERRYDQFTATVETTAKRASLLDRFEDVAGKRLLFLGDDDYTSVAVANIQKASDITILDIDDRILDNIGKIAKNESLAIGSEHYDARKPLPADHLQKYDVVFTDPPYTPEGIELFVSRAIQALDLQNQSARIYICYGNSDRARERFLPVYKIFEASGLMIRWVFDKFNRYEGAESIGSSSTLFVLDITSKTKVSITSEYDKPIYTNN